MFHRLGQKVTNTFGKVQTQKMGLRLDSAHIESVHERRERRRFIGTTPLLAVGTDTALTHLNQLHAHLYRLHGHGNEARALQNKQEMVRDAESASTTSVGSAPPEPAKT